MTSAAPTAPTPPAAKTSPRSLADPCSVFLTTNGRSASVGPEECEICDRGRQQRSPEPDVAAHEPETVGDGRDASRRMPDRATPAGRSPRTVIAETRKVAGVQGERGADAEEADEAPPSAGPTSRSAIGRTNWSSAFACGELIRIDDVRARSTRTRG